MVLLTPRLKLTLQSLAEVEAMIAALPEEHREQVSPDWLAQLRSSADGDPYTRAFTGELIGGGKIGTCAFKGPPVDGVVEISYAVDEEHQGKGYATELAGALFAFAAASSGVVKVIAHTLPSGAASQRVLLKNGFTPAGEAVDPDEGPVLRFEKPCPKTAR